MKYGIVKFGEIQNSDVLTEDELRERFSTISLPTELNDEILEKLSIVKLPYPDMTQYNLKELSTQRIVTTVEKGSDGTFKRVPILQAVSDVNAQKRYNQRVIQIKYIRKNLLDQTDYTDLPSYTKDDKEEWATWRQQLRDLLNQGLDPYEIVIPEPPYDLI